MNKNAVYRLSEQIGDGVYCGEQGLYVGATPLLEAVETDLGFVSWRVRDPKPLERDLRRIYGHHVDFNFRRPGVETVAQALTRGDLARAQIAALLLRLPDPLRTGPMKNDETKTPASL